MTDRLVDVVVVARWVDRAGVDHGPQRLPVIADGVRRWLDIPANLVGLYDPSMTSVSIRAEVTRGYTRADERALRDLHAAAVAPWIGPSGSSAPTPRLVDASGEPLRDLGSPPPDGWLLGPDRVMGRTDDGRRVEYDEPAPDAYADSVTAERIIGRLARDAYARLSGVPNAPTPKVAAIALAIPGEVDRLWPDVDAPAPTRDAVAKVLDRWLVASDQPDRQFRDAVRSLDGWPAILAASRRRR